MRQVILEVFMPSDKDAKDLLPLINRGIQSEMDICGMDFTVTIISDKDLQTRRDI